MASTINGTSTGSGGLISTGDDSGILNIQTNETTAITVDTSQRVAFVAGTAALPAITTAGDTNTGIFFPAADTIAFSEGGAEAMRIDSSGNLLVGTTSQFSSGKICELFDEQAVVGISLKSSNATVGGSYMYFVNSSGSLAGSINHNATGTVAYNTSSDKRLKEDNGVATDTSIVDNIVIHDFKWKSDNKIDRGVFAQEAYEVKPSAVSIGSDELTEDGNLEKPWSVDYSKFVPDLIVHAQQLKKMVQEQQALITAQAETINALTARIVALEGQ